jgi:hypothetical protein
LDYKCQCPPTHEGSLCQYKKCRNGGIRIETGECECPEVFEGGFSFKSKSLIKFSDTCSFADSEKYSITMLIFVGVLGIFVGVIMNMMCTKIIGNFI